MSHQPALFCACLLLGLAGCDSGNSQQMVGTLERDRVEIKVESSEPIINRRVIDGQAVKAGDVLFEQDPARASAQYEQKTALHAQAAARLAELRRGPRPEAIRETRAKLAAAQAVTANAEADLKRERELFDKKLSNQAALDRAETAWKSATAEVEIQRQALEAQLNGTTLEELAQAEAAASAAESLQALAALDLKRTHSIAPVDGVVDKMLYQVGERPPVGATVAVLLDSSRVYARVYVPEHLRARVIPGSSIKLKVDGIAGEMSGTVRWVSSDASFTPYFALTEHDRSRLSYLAEIDLAAAGDLPSGIPVVATLPPP
jgi:HlyD family secretion protein